MPVIPGILYNVILISAMTAWLAAQLLKVLINLFLVRELDFDFF